MAASTTTLADLLARLSEDGRVEVLATLGPAPDPDDALDGALRALDARARRDAPGEPPALDPEAARWAARSLYAACQGLALRGVPASDVAAALSAPAPEPSPSAAWSVDLAFAVLPDLARLARGLPPADPLRAALAAWARRWPLSSVGLALDGPLDAAGLEAVLGHEALLALYVDRLMARRDVARLAAPRVADAARAALGLHGALCPDVADALQGAAP